MARFATHQEVNDDDDDMKLQTSSSPNRERNERQLKLPFQTGVWRRPAKIDTRIPSCQEEKGRLSDTTPSAPRHATLHVNKTFFPSSPKSVIS